MGSLAVQGIIEQFAQAKPYDSKDLLNVSKSLRADMYLDLAGFSVAFASS